MNPFKITDIEYGQNFGEKKNFLKSLIFLIFKGSEAPSKIEDKIINQTIVEYYENYFEPFHKFTDDEREQLRKRLLLEDKKNGTYEKHEKELEDRYKHYEYGTSDESEASEGLSAFDGQNIGDDSLGFAADGSMADDDFKVVIKNTKKSVTIPKAEMILDENENYLFTVDTGFMGTGEYWITTIAYVPDDDFDDGLRTEVQKQLLCVVTS